MGENFHLGSKFILELTTLKKEAETRIVKLLSMNAYPFP